MWYALFQALAAILAPIIGEIVGRSTDAVKAIDAPFNIAARKRWISRVRKFKSRIRPGK